MRYIPELTIGSLVGNVTGNCSGSSGSCTGTAANASQLLTKTWAAPGSIGSGTPAAGAFTTVSASGTISANGGDLTTTDLTANLFNTGATSLNIGGASIMTTIGASTDNSETLMNGIRTRAVTSTTAGVGTLLRANLYIENRFSDAALNAVMRLECNGAAATLKYITLFRLSPAPSSDCLFIIYQPNTSTEAFRVDAKTGNTTVGGYLNVNGGDITAGVAATTRGVFTARRGTGTDKPGCLSVISRSGTQYWIWAEDDGTLRIHNALPTADSDGGIVGAQT
jgi:hypothetical protein